MIVELKLTGESEPAGELRIWFLLDGATDCYVRLKTSADEQSVALVDTILAVTATWPKCVRTMWWSRVACT